MKKFIAVLSAAIIFCLAFSGCANKNPVKLSVSLAQEPVATEKQIDINETNQSVEINFEVPQKGYIKISAYDDTNYLNWSDEEADFFVSFKDTAGNILFDNIGINNGMHKECLFEKGNVTAVISFVNKPKNMSCLAVSWAYAPVSNEPVELALDKTVAACVNENGESVFTFTADTDGLYGFAPTEACVSEWDCTFRIETPDGKPVSDDLFIHGTEWTSRHAFLPEGDYVITVTDTEIITSFLVKKNSETENAVLEAKDGLTVPVQFGFTLLNSGERSARLITDDKTKFLLVVAAGSETYYDSVHTAEVKITDSQGNVVYEETCEEISKIDISKYSGEYTVTVSASGCCAVELMTMEK